MPPPHDQMAPRSNFPATAPSPSGSGAAIYGATPSTQGDKPSLSTMGTGICNVGLTNLFGLRMDYYSGPAYNAITAITTTADKLTGYLGSQSPTAQTFTATGCDYTATNTVQFRYSNGSSAGGDVNQSIMYEVVSAGSVTFQFGSGGGGAISQPGLPGKPRPTPTNPVPAGSEWGELVLTLRGADRLWNTPVACNHGGACGSFKGTWPVLVNSFNSYSLNGTYYNAGNAQPGYSGVYVPVKPGYDVSVTNGSWNPSTRIVTPNAPVNAAGAPVYGTDLMSATNAVTTITYVKPAANATVHWNVNGVENTGMQQSFNGRQDDPLSAVLTARIPAGYYAQPASPGLSCNDTTCSINTTYPAGHSDYWINCQPLPAKVQTKTQTRTIHYQYQHDHTQAAPDRVDTVTWTREQRTNPVTGTVSYTSWVTANSNDGTTKTTGYYPQADSPHLDGWTTHTPTTQAQTTAHTDGTPVADPANPAAPVNPELTNRTSEITITYYPAVKALPFTGGATTAAIIAVAGLIIAVIFLAIASALKHKQHHTTAD